MTTRLYYTDALARAFEATVVSSEPDGERHRVVLDRTLFYPTSGGQPFDIGRLGTVFFDTLLDENAASHIALGDGFDQGLSDEDRKRRNRSAIHIDFMIGGDDVAVTGITREGERVPVLRGGSWQL